MNWIKPLNAVWLNSTEIYGSQLGFPEEWLRSIFANLTQDLYSALRAAWLSMMIIHKHHMCQAELTEYSRMLAFARAASPYAAKRVSEYPCDLQELPPLTFILAFGGRSLDVLNLYRSCLACTFVHRMLTAARCSGSGPAVVGVLRRGGRGAGGL